MQIGSSSIHDSVWLPVSLFAWFQVDPFDARFYGSQIHQGRRPGLRHWCVCLFVWLVAAWLVKWWLRHLFGNNPRPVLITTSINCTEQTQSDPHSAAPVSAPRYTSTSIPQALHQANHIGLKLAPPCNMESTPAYFDAHRGGARNVVPLSHCFLGCSYVKSA